MESFNFIIDNKYCPFFSLKGQNQFIFKKTFGQNQSLRNCSLPVAVLVTIALIAAEVITQVLLHRSSSLFQQVALPISPQRMLPELLRATFQILGNMNILTRSILKWDWLTSFTMCGSEWHSDSLTDFAIAFICTKKLTFLLIFEIQKSTWLKRQLTF